MNAVAILGRFGGGAGSRSLWRRIPARVLAILGAGLIGGIIIVSIGGAIGTAAAAENGTGKTGITFFRIGTGATGGTYFPVGGLIASAISNPPGSRPCDEGGSCGVPGLIAVAQSTHGSVENVEEIGSGKLDSALSQADVAYWAYSGQGVFAGKKPVTSLRAIANLYPEAVHVVVRQDAGITSVADLRGKLVSVGEMGSGTTVGARVILGAYGFTEEDIRALHVKPGQAADMLERGSIDAFFLVAGVPVPAIADLAKAVAESGGPKIDLVPIWGAKAVEIRRYYPFFRQRVIPTGTYEGVQTTLTLSVGAQWVVSSHVSDDLVYAITKALWHKTSIAILGSGHPMGKEIRIETALDGIAIPLHPGAARYYREIGMIK